MLCIFSDRRGDRDSECSALSVTEDVLKIWECSMFSGTEDVVETSECSACSAIGDVIEASEYSAFSEIGVAMLLSNASLSRTEKDQDILALQRSCYGLFQVDYI